MFQVSRTNTSLPDLSDCSLQKGTHWFIRLLNDIHFGTNLKAFNAFKTFFFFLFKITSIT